MSAPVNVKLETPTITIPNWSQEAEEWRILNAEVPGNPAFYPLTIKAAYVIGVIHGICQSVQCLLQHPGARTVSYIPAYGIFASALELLGRCINGNSSKIGATTDLKAGLKWLASSSCTGIPDTHVLIQTSSNSYTIAILAALRHFAAHGQAVSSPLPPEIDYELLEQMPPKLANGLERYWNQLQCDEILCNKLAQASILRFRSWNIFLSWTLFEKDASGHYNSMTEIFERFNWRV